MKPLLLLAMLQLSQDPSYPVDLYPVKSIAAGISYANALTIPGEGDRFTGLRYSTTDCPVFPPDKLIHAKWGPLGLFVRLPSDGKIPRECFLKVIDVLHYEEQYWIQKDGSIGKSQGHHV